MRALFDPDGSWNFLSEYHRLMRGDLDPIVLQNPTRRRVRKQLVDAFSKQCTAGDPEQPLGLAVDQHKLGIRKRAHDNRRRNVVDDAVEKAPRFGQLR